jgi:PAS domain S-box-containing protein
MKFFENLWNPPARGGDDSRTLMAEMLQRVILIIFLLTVSGLLAIPFFYEKQTGSLLIVMALLATVALSAELLRQGKLRLSGVCVVSGAWLSFVCLALFGGGVGNINVVFFLSLTVVAGLLLERRAAFWVAAASVATALALAVAEILDYLPSRYFMNAPLGNWLQLSFAVVLTTGALNLALRGRDEAVTLARRQLDERAATEEALSESAERYRSIYENALEGIYQSTPEGRFISVNPAMARMCGYASPGEMLVGVTDIATQYYANPLDRERFREMIHDRGYIDGIEYQVRRTDGSLIWVSTSARLVRNEKGRILYYEGRSQDISQRRQVEEALKKSEEFSTRLIEAIPDIVIRTDITGEILFINDRGLEASGYVREEIVGGNMLSFIAPDDRERAFRNTVLMLEKSLGPKEYHLLMKDAGSLLCEVNGDVLKTEAGAPYGMVYVIRDLTDRKRLEEERVELRERLYRAEKMEAIGALAGGVAHDLNNILGVLVGYSELLLEKIPEADPSRKYVANILKSGERGAAVIQDLLTLARRGVAISEVVHFNGVVSEFLGAPEFERLKVDNPSVIFKTKLDKDILNLKGSPVHLGKIVMNLVYNAVEAIETHGEVTISTQNRYLDRLVRGYDEISEGDYVVLTVSDTGKGIAQEDLGRIFDPFYTKKVMGRSGTGLGLAVVWGTVKDHNGYIDVQSEEGRGSTFSVFLPATREAVADAEKSAPLESYRGRGELILVVDDIPEQREVARSILERLGYEVETVSSGREAVEYLRRGRIDLVVLDMIMQPGMDGLDTYRKIIEVQPQQKAVVVSGFSENERVRTTLALGAGAYVRKPYLMERIGLAIRKELDRIDGIILD